MRRLTLLFCLSVVLLCTVAINAQEIAPSEQVVPVYLVNDYLVIVRGSIGGMEKRNLLIDTGAHPTVITRDLAKKLNLSGSSEQLQAVGHNMNSQVVYLPSLQVGPIEVHNLRVLVQDLTEFDKKLGLHLDAVVGLDVLAHSSFRIDYHTKRMTFGPVPLLPYSAPIHLTGYMACIDARVDGQTVPMLLDTGAFDVLLFSERVAGMAHKPGAVWNTTNMAGHFAVRQVKLNRLEAAGTDLGPSDAFVTERTNADRYPYAGLLAIGSQRFRQVAFDFERQSFSWEPAKSPHGGSRVARDSSLALASPEGHDASSRTPGACSDDSSAKNLAQCNSPAAFTADPASR